MKSFSFPLCIGELNHTPVGDLRLAVSDLGLVAVEWADSQPDFDSYLLQSNADVVASYANELREYLEGKRRAFTFPIHWDIFRPFQKEALQKVFKIPYGETRTSAAISA
jgi:O6-methylguanine-DNA--protein-cysteine methyltransferase